MEKQERRKGPWKKVGEKRKVLRNRVGGKKKVPPLWEDFNEHVGVSIGTGGTSLEGKIMWLLVC